MKLLAILLLFLAIVPAVFADIAVKTSQNVYNIGNGVGASVSVLRANSFEGLFKLAIECGDYKLDYFLTPVNLEANFMTAINVPELTASKSMIANCTLIGSLMSENQIIEQADSNLFEITDQLSILPIQSKITALPADSILIAGIVNEAFGDNVLKATTNVALENLSLTIDALDGKFNATIKIPKNIKSGRHSIGISSSDSKGNSGAYSVELYITPVPSYLKIDLSQTNLDPGKKADITSAIFDQADDVINDSLNLELTSPSKNKIFTKTAQSDEKFDYEFSQYAEPGIYNLIANYRNLQAQASLNITQIREIKIKYQNQSVIVENIGNVIFEDELTFILESNSKKYTITKKVKIEPGKTLTLDLSKEVPFGVYNILVRWKEGFDLATNKLNNTFNNLAGLTQSNITSLFSGQDGILADGVVINDNRPVYKKIGSGLTSISDFLVGADGILAKNPIVAPMIVLAVLLLIFIRYGGKPLLRFIKGRKKNEEKKD